MPPNRTPGSKSLGTGVTGKVLQWFVCACCIKEGEGQRRSEYWEDDQARSEVHHPDTNAQGDVPDVTYLNAKTLQDIFAIRG